MAGEIGKILILTGCFGWAESVDLSISANSLQSECQVTSVLIDRERTSSSNVHVRLDAWEEDGREQPRGIKAENEVDQPGSSALKRGCDKRESGLSQAESGI